MTRSAGLVNFTTDLVLCVRPYIVIVEEDEQSIMVYEEKQHCERQIAKMFTDSKATDLLLVLTNSKRQNRKSRARSLPYDVGQGSLLARNQGQ